MFALAFATFKRNIAFFAIVLLVVVMLESMMQARGFVPLAFAALTMLYSHRMIQMGEHYTWTDPLSTRGSDGNRVPIFLYSLRFIALFVIVMLILAGVFMALAASGYVDFQSAEGQATGTALGFALATPLVALLLGYFGTVLPACAERGDTSLINALTRGQKTLPGFMTDFVMGPAVTTLVGMLILMALPLSGTSPASNILSIAAWTILMQAVSLLAATALTLAYLKAEGRNPASGA